MQISRTLNNTIAKSAPSMPSFQLGSILLILVFTLFSCGNTEKKKEETLRKQVMEIHDLQMEKMGVLHNLKKQLRKVQSELKADTMQKSGLLIRQIDKKITKLEDADEAMMSWMHNYQDPVEDMTDEEVMHYLNEQKKKIREVEKKMKESMDDAKMILEK